MGFTEYEQNGLVWLTADVLPCTHGFTTRFGGVSKGVFASLNLGERTEDDPAAVLENYRRLREALGLRGEGMAFTRQVHGTEVRVITEEHRRQPLDGDRPACDGLVTKMRRLPLIIFSADCIPVLLCEPDAGVIGAVHCGWRSTVRDILGTAVLKMCSLGARPEKIRAAIGPGIGGCCFETGPEVGEALFAWLGEGSGRFCAASPDNPEKMMVDLRGADRERLLRLGLRSQHIAVSDECTKCRPDKYWSHRVTGPLRGSQAAVISLDG
jgi:YfiH family protein